MLVSVAVDAAMWGWWFAVGFVILLFVHEMGHVALVLLYFGLAGYLGVMLMQLHHR